MQVCVAGTWEEHKARSYAEMGKSLGKKIALRGYDLSCGPGTGMARHVVDGYRSVANRGKVRYYLPAIKEMELVGETIEEGSDEIIQTELDYPMRNIYQIKNSNAVVIITGGDGTLEEAICALSDYHLPVSVLKDSGKAAKALELLQDIFVDWQEKLLISSDIDELLEHIKIQMRV